VGDIYDVTVTYSLVSGINLFFPFYISTSTKLDLTLVDYSIINWGTYVGIRPHTPGATRLVHVRVQFMSTLPNRFSTDTDSSCRGAPTPNATTAGS
jgi:hypothetical protein